MAARVHHVNTVVAVSIHWAEMLQVQNTDASNEHWIKIISWAGWFKSYLVENTEDRFSRDEALIIITINSRCTPILPPMKNQTSQLMRLWNLSHRRPTKASLCIRAVSPEPSLFAHVKGGGTGGGRKGRGGGRGEKGEGERGGRREKGGRKREKRGREKGDIERRKRGREKDKGTPCTSPHEVCHEVDKKSDI